MIDIGQGDSILIRLKYNKGNILIDTGGIPSYVKEEWKKSHFSLAKSTIIPYLKSVGIKKLDTLVLTHGDFDHLGEANYLINNFKIDNVLLNSNHNNKNEENIIKLLKEKTINFLNISKYTLELNDYQFHFINKEGSNENNDSLIMYTKINNKHILLMGDADKNNENYLLKEYNLPKMDILKVGHHGSKYSSDINFLKYINPRHALISAGLNNKFNHPHKETLDNLDKLEIPYYITSINGSIKILLKNNIEIYTCS